MADEPMTAASSVLPIPPTHGMETTQSEDVIKANDISMQETVSSADFNAKVAAGGEGMFSLRYTYTESMATRHRSITLTSQTHLD